MALGVSLLFNIKLPINFNSPYKAKNIQDFWRRWHITLSRFLKDYIYIPLGGNRLGEFRTYANLMMTFVLGGLWHGAGWTFIFWGFLHGLALIIHRFWEKLGFKMNNALAWFITFNFVNIAWIFFRAKEWSDAIKVLSGMFCGDIVLPSFLSSSLAFLGEYGVAFGGFIANIQGDYFTLFWLFQGFILFLFFKNSMELQKTFKINILYLIFTILILTYSISNIGTYTEFLYFNF